MSGRRRVIDGVTFEVWEKSFRVVEPFAVSATHFMGDTLDATMLKVAQVIHEARKLQHREDTKHLNHLPAPPGSSPRKGI